MRPIRFVWSAADRDGVAAAQTSTGTAKLILNGALVIPAQPSGVAAYAAFDPGANRTVSIFSTGDLSGITFTIVGLDGSGNTVSEAKVGPNNTTVYTTALFNKVLSVTPSATVGTNVEIGSGTTGATNWVEVDWMTGVTDIGLWLQITATINVTVQLTPDDFKTMTPYAFAHAMLTAIAADAASSLNYPAQGVRMLVNSSTVATGAAVFTYIQSALGRGR